MRIALRFVLALMACIVAVQLAAVAVRVQREKALFEQDVARDSRVLGRALGHAVEQTWSAKGQRDALAIIRYATEQESHLDIRFVWLDPGADDAHAPRAPAADIERVRRGQSVATRVGGSDGVLYTYAPVRVGPDQIGAIEIGDSLADERDYLQRSIFNAGASALLMVVLTGAIALALGYRIIGIPARRLIDHANAVGAGDLRGRVSATANNELADLAAAMNTMTAQLASARSKLVDESERRIATLEQLRHADRLKTVGTLASGVAHELGTPINVIEGHAQLIREAHQGDADGPTTEHAAIITRQCKRMAKIIRQLLDFARRGGERAEISDARAAIEEAVEMLAPRLRQRAIEVEVHLPESQPRARIAFIQLQQVVTNLLLNAIDAMDGGGDLRLDVDTCPGDRDDYLRIHVADTGVGMTPDTIERIFEPFFTTKDVGDGTGLGLAVAYGIVHDHAGWIEVRSEPGRGSEFTVFLPAEVANAA